jgi:hypothetical protein
VTAATKMLADYTGVIRLECQHTCRAETLSFEASALACLVSEAALPVIKGNTPGPRRAGPGRLAFEQPAHIVRKARRR